MYSSKINVYRRRRPANTVMELINSRHVLTVIVSLGGLLTFDSRALGQVWIPASAPSNAWVSVASSANGIKLVAAATVSSNSGNGLIYTSTNSGSTWLASGAPSSEWKSVASSADGTKLVAVSQKWQIYTSSDSGATWSLATNGAAPGFPWVAVASSADGTKLVAVGSMGLTTIYTSTNSGSSWIAREFPVPTGAEYLWSSVASSADGTILVAAASEVVDNGLSLGGGMVRSTDSGSTWINCFPFVPWSAVALSANGTELIAASENGLLYTTTNWGSTYTSNSVPGTSWSSVASSADGSHLVAVGLYFGELYTEVSTNAGITWATVQAQLPAADQALAAVASSGDGSKLVAVASGGLIYTWQPPPLAIALSGAYAILSWPSLTSTTGFLLQQNPDLAPAHWTLVADTPTVRNGQNLVIVPTTSVRSFFRLTRP